MKEPKKILLKMPEPKNKIWFNYYSKFISTRKGVGKYKHHILPKSMGGSNENYNIIQLTTREHFIAHMILWRTYRNQQTNRAFQYMLGTYTHNFHLTSRQYESLMKEFSNFLSVNNPMKNPDVAKKVHKKRKENRENGTEKPRKVSPEEKKNISERMRKNNPMKNLDSIKKRTEARRVNFLNGEMKVKTFSEEQRRKSSERMRKNNPMKNPETAKRVADICREKGVYEKHSERMKNNPPTQDPEVRKKLKEFQNKWIYKTPFGNFESSEEAHREIVKKTGSVVKKSMLIVWCKGKIISFRKGCDFYYDFFDKKDKGKSTNELGWGRVLKRKRIY